MRERYTRHWRAGVVRVHRRSMAREREITREGVVESVVRVPVKRVDYRSHAPLFGDGHPVEIIERKVP